MVERNGEKKSESPRFTDFPKEFPLRSSFILPLDPRGETVDQNSGSQASISNSNELTFVSTLPDLWSKEVRNVDDHCAQANARYDESAPVWASLLRMNDSKVTLERKGHEEHHTHAWNERKEID